MQRRTRNGICIWLIGIGLANFLAYTVVYGIVGGDARNGGHERAVNEQGQTESVYFIRGHFIHGPTGQREDVPRWVWIYSYMHSTSLWLSMAIIMIPLLVLAQPHIIATMSEGFWVRGAIFVAVAVTLIAVFCGAMTVWFIFDFVRQLSGS